MPIQLRLQELHGKGDGGWREREKKKCLCIVFRLIRRSRVRGRNTFLFCCFLHPVYSTSKKISLVARHILITGLKNAFKVDSRNPLSPPFIVKKVRTGSKSGQGT